MVGRVLKAIFGSQNERIIKKYMPTVNKINALEPEIQSLSDDELKSKTGEFKHRLSEGHTLNDILPEAFAVVREASVRTLKMRHFDVQLIGAMVINEGKIAEMKTGEGKTLMSTLPVYLNALSGKGVHVVTVNDYLAKRDKEWMQPIFDFLGITVDFIQHDMRNEARSKAYQADVTYGTNNEFGFDYLRDNMVDYLEHKVQRGHNFAIVDEVDSILIDEARTPLIISGAAEDSTELYYSINKIIPHLKPANKGEDDKWIQDSGDYQFEEKDRNVVLTETGTTKVEKLLGIDNLYGPENIELIHHVNQALKAHVVFKREVDYIVDEGEVKIIDEHTGRTMEGRRYSDGLHQALEAKENVRIEQETQTLASITFQNYFRMYDKLSGMTGTAETEAEEFHKIYKLSVAVIPTNLPMARIDNADRIYRTEKEKVEAVLDEIEECYKSGQPVLVGTISIEKNEMYSKALKKRNIPHNVLNAKFHEMEAQIVAQAGNRSAITIATNMAGRGTDIKITDEIRELGGLHILGTERHESRRIDNQLRGRSGRQGDPGSSRFYLSLEDELMRLFGSGRIGGLMQKMGMEEGQEIEHPWISKAIANAQKKVEGRNFEVRKHLLEYDDVNNRQRQYIYEMRDKVLMDDDVRGTILNMIDEVVQIYIDESLNGKRSLGHEDVDDIISWVEGHFGLKAEDNIDRGALANADTMEEYLIKWLKDAYDNRVQSIGENQMKEVERFICLHTIDSKWKDHLHNLDVLKEGIHWRAQSEKNPLVEYKREASQMFEVMKVDIMLDLLEFLYKVEVKEEFAREESSADFDFGDTVHQEVNQFGQVADPVTAAGAKKAPKKGGAGVKKVKIKPNDPCPCGSGKKYKKCCGK